MKYFWLSHSKNIYLIISFNTVMIDKYMNIINGVYMIGEGERDPCMTVNGVVYPTVLCCGEFSFDMEEEPWEKDDWDIYQVTSLYATGSQFLCDRMILHPRSFLSPL